MKGNITEAQAQEIRDLKAKVAAEKEANLPQQMIENISKGRMNKYFQENALMEQIYEADDSKDTVAQYHGQGRQGIEGHRFEASEPERRLIKIGYCQLK